MDWHQHFQQVFFERWQAAGLPHPQLYTAAYVDAREHHLQNVSFLETDMANESGIPYNQLKSVYGFGKVTGELLAELSGLSKETTLNVADWCGRFNLGISLFDYICDELNGQELVRSLPVFQTFFSAPYKSIESINPAVQLLSLLAASVFKDVKTLGSVEIEKAMKTMMEAELLHAESKIYKHADLKTITQALYLKSAEPFRVMAVYAGLSGNIQEPLLSYLQQFGKAMGHCYWLIDDARDLWDDVDVQKWNWLLTTDAEVSGITSKEVLTLKLKELNTAVQLSDVVISELMEAMKVFDAQEEVKKRIAGFIGASLWQWFCY